MTLLCIASRCALPRQHTTGCKGEPCRGCLPDKAIPGEAFCEACANKLRRWLDEIPDLFAEVVDPPDVTDTREAHQGVTKAALDVGPPAGYPRDPVAALLPAGAVVVASRNPRVSGSPEDMLAVRYVEAGVGKTVLRPDRKGRVYADDQTGEVPPAVLLDSWARDWQTIPHVGLGEFLPPPTVELLCAWLLARLGLALRHHPAMAEFYEEIASLHGRLWGEAGRSEARPELCVGVPCRRCDLLSLWRNADGSNDVECHNPDCRTMYRADEYRRWVSLVAAAAARDEEVTVAHGAQA